MTDERYEIKLDIFEGPLDLLVHLIRKNEVDIYDIPIGLITDQFLEYIEWMKTMNVDFAGDFLLMASTLTHIKSRMLIPAHEGDEDEEDPRMEITRPLLEYIQMKSAAEQLSSRDLLGEFTFVRKPDKKEFLADYDEGFIQVGLFELIDAFQKILDNVSPDHRIDLASDRVSVKDKITELVEILEKKETVTFSELFSEDADKQDVIVTFLAILEMVKLSLIKIIQHIQSGIIRLIYV